MESLAFGLTYAISALGAGIGAGLVGMGALNAAGRNPEKIGDLRGLMILAVSFVEALAIIGFVVAILVKFL